MIDLDTVMSGTIQSDFGERVRTATCRAPEDEINLAAMQLDDDLYEALARGYLMGAAEFLTTTELQTLPLAGPALALMNALRFLTDYILGDVYFRVHHEGHNLERARAIADGGAVVRAPRPGGKDSRGSGEGVKDPALGWVWVAREECAGVRGYSWEERCLSSGRL